MREILSQIRHLKMNYALVNLQYNYIENPILVLFFNNRNVPAYELH